MKKDCVRVMVTGKQGGQAFSMSRRQRWLNAIPLVILLFAGISYGQGTTKAAAPVGLTEADLSRGKSVAEFPDATVMGEPVACSSAGTIYADVYASTQAPQVSSSPVLYAIDRSGGVTRIDRRLPETFSGYNILSTYADSRSVVTLMSARRKKTPLDPFPDAHPVFLMVRSMQDGRSDAPVVLDLPFRPRKLASFEDGELVVAGVDEANLVPVVAIIGGDGRVKRPVDLEYRRPEHRDGAKGATAAQGAMADARTVSNAMDGSAFVPFGDRILFVQAGTAQPMRVMTPEGVAGSIRLKPEAGYLVHDVLPGDGKVLVVRLESEADLRAFAEKHIQENPQMLSGVFDPVTGRVQRYLKVKGPNPGEILCSGDRTLTALYFPDVEGSAPSTAASGMVLATAPY